MKIMELLTFTVKQNASDLHLSPGQPPILRRDGEIQRINLPQLEADEIKTLVHEVMSKAQRSSLDACKELDFAYELQGLARFRINLFHTRTGISAVFRNIPQKIPDMQQLACPPVLASLLSQSGGLILVTGPTGSGKSTTLAAMVDHINSHYSYHLITIEDPVEFVHQSRRSLINQRELSSDTLGFDAALRAALREDPDVILVGELRDLETIRLALTAAETGHLVLATLHTSSAAKSVNRMIDVFPGGEKSLIRSTLSDSLRAVVSQRLIKSADGGRRAAFEVLVNTPAVRNLIREDKIAQIFSLMQTGAGLGMETMDQALQRLVRVGKVKQEVIRPLLTQCGVSELGTD
ncbi:MAG: type IV pilus twitching motility protein PilT [Gammaproteobacteria bacterium]|nr:type IV pilus twitching motility protein PilT [Gammaproteobacteria bacterium]